MKVSRIEIETEAGKILLTIKEAKKLHTELSEIFGKQKEIVTKIIEVQNDRWPITKPHVYPPYESPVWCKTTTGTDVTIGQPSTISLSVKHDES